MGQEYSNPERENDQYALPDLEIFQLTAREAAELDEDMVYEYSKRHEFRMSSMNSRDRERMFDTMIEEEGIKGGWFYWYCFPGCIPDSSAMGPYDNYEKALEAARSECFRIG